MIKQNTLILLITFSFGLSSVAQDIHSLTIIHDSLTNVKNDLNRQLAEVSSELKNIDEKIALIQLDSIKQTAITGYTKKTLSGNLRKGIMPGSALVTVIPTNSKIQIIGYSDAYFKVIYKNQVGYLNEIFVQNSDEIESYKKVFEDSGTKFKTSSPTSTKHTSYTPKTSKTYYKGPRGGCYYYSSSGKKVYVDRGLCN